MKTTYSIPHVGGVAVLVEVPGLDRVWVVSRLSIQKEFRGRGYGSMLLQMICDQADENGAEVRLSVVPSDGLDWRALHDWYVRYGFVDDPMLMMIRYPRREG